MTPNKSDLRSAAKSRRQGRASAVPSSELLTFINQEFAPGSRIGCYLNKVGELDTTRLIDSLRGNYEIYAPGVVNEEIVWRKHDGNVQFGKFGIVEPTSLEVITPDELACVLIPALAVDRSGNRLGFGAGYFDRNLKAYSNLVIALIFESDLLSEVPAEPHDVKVDYIATENRLIRTTK